MLREKLREIVNIDTECGLSNETAAGTLKMLDKMFSTGQVQTPSSGAVRKRIKITKSDSPTSTPPVATPPVATRLVVTPPVVAPPKDGTCDYILMGPDERDSLFTTLTQNTPSRDGANSFRTCGDLKWMSYLDAAEKCWEFGSSKSRWKKIITNCAGEERTLGKWVSHLRSDIKYGRLSKTRYAAMKLRKGYFAWLVSNAQ